ncbi:MAG: metal-dependent transcriptional regulator [Melioribacteraceae bacterium]
MNPLFALLIGVFILVILFFLFKPQRGLVSRLMKMKKDGSRELIEDALKHLYDCEYKGVDCSLNSISGSLFISGDRSAHIISMLEAMNLISSVGNKITLTPEGRSYALRVIRVHRLLEKYLAEKTSVNETDWHIIAEEKEHKVSQEEANKLAAQLGNPLLDPHGDPIPSENGEIPTRKGLTLNNLESGTFATIIHIEDEPKEVYAQLSALKLYPGMQIYLLENSKERISFEADGEECVLAPILASNVTVYPIVEKENVKDSFETLSLLNQDEEAIVIGISKAMRGQQRRRLLDFGIVPGTVIRAQLKSLSGDPTGYEIRGATIALRKKQSSLIYIKRIDRKLVA